jgi:hypothetical protein
MAKILLKIGCDKPASLVRVASRPELATAENWVPIGGSSSLQNSHPSKFLALVM